MEERQPRGCLRKLVIAALVLLILFAIGVAGLRWWAIEQLKKNIGAAKYQEIHQFMMNPVTIPPEAQKFTRISPELQTALLTFESGFVPIEQLTVNVFEAGWAAGFPSPESMTEQELTSLSLYLKTAGPWVDQGQALAHRSDFDADCVDAFSGSTGDIYVAVREVVKVLHWRAAAAAKSGNYPEALEDAIEILRFARRSPYSREFTHTRALAACTRATSAVVDISRRVTDIGALEHTLSELRSLRSQTDLNLSPAGKASEIIVGLRAVAQGGLPVNLSSGQTGADLFDQLFINQNQAGWYLNRFKKPLTRLGSFFGLRETVASMLFWPDVQASHQKQILATAQFDLTEIFVASRIRKLKTGDDVTSLSVLVPEFFRSAPTDPFSGVSYKWSGRWKQFYSVGPDMTDDHLDTEFVADKHNAERGDITLPSIGEPRVNDAQTSGGKAHR